MKISKWVRILFFSAIIILVILSFYIIYGRNKGEVITADSKKKDNDITYDFSIGITNYDTINPILTHSKDCRYISKLIYNSLLRVDKDFNVVPDIAKEWSRLNNKCYIIKLNDNYLWHDGQVLTAEDIKFTIEGIKRLKQFPYYKYVEPIDEVGIIDNQTLKLFLNKEMGNFEYNLCFPILAKHAYDEETLENKTNIPIGTGDYRILDINENQMVLTNDKRKINVYIFKEVKQMYNAFIKEKVDLIFTENIYYENYIGKIGYEENISSGQKYGYIIINTERVDKETRQVLNYGINKNNINYEIFDSKFKIANFPLEYKEYLHIQDMDLYEYNPNKIIHLDEDVELILLVDNSKEKLLEVAEKIKEQLKDYRIDIQIIQYRKEDFDYYIYLNNYDLILLEENIDIDFAINKYFIENNYSHFKNDAINYLLKEIDNINNDRILMEKYNQIIQIYKEENPFISLYFSGNIILYNSRLKGNFEHNWDNLFFNIDNWYKKN